MFLSNLKSNMPLEIWQIAELFKDKKNIYQMESNEQLSAQM